MLLCVLPSNIKQSLYLYQINKDLHETFNLSFLVTNSHPEFSTPDGLNQMATIRLGGCPNFQAVPISLQNQLRSLWNSKLKLLGTQLIIKLSNQGGGSPKWLQLELGNVPIFILSLYFCQINSDFYETLCLSSWGPNLSSQVVYSRFSTQNDLGNVPIFMLFLYICQINSDLYETLNLSSWGTNLSSKVVHSRWATPNGYYKTLGMSQFSLSP